MPRGDGKGPPQNGGRRQGRMGGSFAAGPGGSCQCPQCGYQTAHVVGQPCNQRRCPKCGAALTRG